MGRDSNAACLDCRQAFDFGYGPGATWLDRAKTVAEYDALATKDNGGQGTLGQLGKNKAWRAFLVLHEGHHFEQWNDCGAGLERAGDRLIAADVMGGEVADVTGFAWFRGDDAGELVPMGEPRR